MNEKTKDTLYHAWSKTPKGRQSAHTYNINYYKANRTKILQKAKARKSSNTSGGNLNPDYKYGTSLLKRIGTSISNAGKNFVSKFKQTKVAKQNRDQVKAGWKWLSDYFSNSKK